MQTHPIVRRFVLLFACTMPASLFAEDLPRINLYTENYGTFNYSLEGAAYEHDIEDIGGTATEIVEKLFNEANIDFKLRLRTWSVSYERAVERPNYGVYSTGRTDSREALFEWVGPVGQYNWILLAKEGHNLNIDSLSDLNGLRIGGYEGDAATTFLQGQGYQVSTLPNESLNAQRLANDLIDVWITSDINGFKIAAESGYPDVEEAFRIRTVGLYLAMNPETDPRVINALNTAYDNLIAEGEIAFD
ncbi:MAG: ABC transporter substrate-binding protein [Saccharospirillum sp.]|uniref:substrate-binding periplasmic protein n=1 Tax=Saccharospirillum sp. TaxID=2033801 RepID=UPI0034A06ABD